METRTINGEIQTCVTGVNCSKILMTLKYLINSVIISLTSNLIGRFSSLYWYNMVKKQNPSNNLARSIKKRKWSSISEHLHEAKYSDDNKTYPLHQVCGDSRVPLSVVKDIYYAHPEAALSKNDHKDIPISIATAFVFEGAVHFLNGSTPI